MPFKPPSKRSNSSFFFPLSEEEGSPFMRFKVYYRGIAYHKRNISGYPDLKVGALRPRKTPCDPLKMGREEAQAILELGLKLGMAPSGCPLDEAPDKVWGVTSHGDVVVAYKDEIRADIAYYHGHPLNSPDAERIKNEWKKRNVL